MVCHNCGRFVSKRQVVKVNVKGYGDADIVYDAICPWCRAKLGKVFWGRLVTSEAPKPAAHAAPPQQAAAHIPQRRICPHCGEVLPSDLDSLPVKRREGDRRWGERRSGTERREADAPHDGPERRSGTERRQGERRQGERRGSKAAPPPPPPVENRRGERRRQNRPVLFDRRRPGTDRRRSRSTGADAGLELKRKV